MTARITMTDFFVVAIVIGGVARGAYAPGAQARVVAAPAVPVVKTEYLVQSVWSPSCRGLAGQRVEDAPSRALEAHVATAEWGDGVRTVMQGDAYATPGRRARRTPYQRARYAAEARWYRDMFRAPSTR